MSKTLKIIMILIILIVFLYSSYLTTWTASYLQNEDSWRDFLHFTPDNVKNPDSIYLIDKYIYVFDIQPFITIIFSLSFITLITIIVSAIISRFKSKEI